MKILNTKPSFEKDYYKADNYRILQVFISVVCVAISVSISLCIVRIESTGLNKEEFVQCLH